MADVPEKTDGAAPTLDGQETQPSKTANDDIEADLEADLNPQTEATTDAANLDKVNMDGANDNAMATDIPILETRIPAKKDASLREFLSKMDDYAPIVGLSNSLSHTQH